MGSSGATYQTIDEGGGLSGPVSSTDNALARWDGTDGTTLQNGLVVENDAGALSGITLLDIDNLRLDANTLSTTNSNGDLALAPNGTGSVNLSGTALNLGGEGSNFASLITADTGGELWVGKNNANNGAPIRSTGLYATAGTYADIDQNTIAVNAVNGKLGFGSGVVVGWGSGAAVGRNPTLDTTISRVGPGEILCGNGVGGVGSRVRRPSG